MREQFTHLDTQLVQDSNLHTDLFINEKHVHDLAQKIEQHRQDPSLGPVQGHITYDFKGKGRKEIEVEVCEYD